MKKTFLILLIQVALIGPAFTQIKTDVELQKLMNLVGTLRQADEATWNATAKALQDDDLWTAMDEALMHENESWLIGGDQFKLRVIHNERSGYDKKMLPGEFLNGNDPHYNYSMTERGVKAGLTVSYELSHRSGRQTFVVMPYVKGCTEVEVGMFRNGQTIGDIVRDTDGNLIITIDDNIKADDTLRLEITNRTENDMPMVIINHNTRKP